MYVQGPLRTFAAVQLSLQGGVKAPLSFTAMI
jgi:hypothetical protein